MLDNLVKLLLLLGYLLRDSLDQLLGIAAKRGRGTSPYLEVLPGPSPGTGGGPCAERKMLTLNI